jgi:hypothetical protein
MTIPEESFAGTDGQSRAFVLLTSRYWLDLLNPGPEAWIDEDRTAGLSQTTRWGGASQWEHSPSVAQHGLTALAIREAVGSLPAGEGLRELLHDATEVMLGCGCISRPVWSANGYEKHNRADRRAAASRAAKELSWSGFASGSGAFGGAFVTNKFPRTPPANHRSIESRGSYLSREGARGAAIPICMMRIA